MPVRIEDDVAADRRLRNTGRHIATARNVDTAPRVAVSVADPADPYRFLSVTSDTEEATTQGARDHIDTVAER